MESITPWVIVPPEVREVAGYLQALEGAHPAAAINSATVSGFLCLGISGAG
jgi:hypothetical protein